jgi:DUF1680 family protein
MLNGFLKKAGMSGRDKYPGSAQPVGTRPAMLAHYLSAASLMYAQTGDDRFKQRVDYIIKTLTDCYRKMAAADEASLFLFNRHDLESLHALAGGRILLDGPDETGYPWGGMGNFWYGIHKWLAGFRDAYLYCDNDASLKLLKQQGDQICELTAGINPDLFDDMLDIEHGGMNEVLADLYALTGEKKYMAASLKFNHQKVILNTALNQDEFFGRHVNMQVPTFVGTAEQYLFTGNTVSEAASVHFFNLMRAHYVSAIGGMGRYERYLPADQETEALGFTSDETCVTYNMLKLAKRGFQLFGDARYMDYYEKALYNDILASQDPVSGGVTYYMSLMPGGFKSYSDGFNLGGVWCCVGTGMENHAKYGSAVYFHNEKGLLTSLYIPSSLNWQQKGLSIKMNTDFPDKDLVDFTIIRNASFKGDLLFRVPSWAKSIQVEINGRLQNKPENAKAGGVLRMKGSWKAGDHISIRFRQTFEIHYSHNDSNMVYFTKGPIVYAAELDKDKMPGSDLVKTALQYQDWVTPQNDVPVLKALKGTLSAWLRPSPSRPGAYEIRNGGRVIASLYPFYKIHHQRYSVYLKYFPASELQRRKANVADEVQVNSRSSEEEHHVQGVNDTLTVFKDNRHFWENNRYIRTAGAGGSFSYQMKTLSGARQQFLSVQYWGASENTDFDILVNGRVIAAEQIGNAHPLCYFSKNYVIPTGIFRPGEEVRVAFRVRKEQNKEATVGGVVALRIGTRSFMNKPYLFY